MFIGKTGIFDHRPNAANQSARIYKTYVEKTDELTSFGEPKVILKATAYMIKCDEFDNLIKKIKQEFPEKKLVITTGTVTGQELAKKKYSEYADFITYFPLDIYEVVDKFRPKYFEIYDSCSTTVIEKMTLSLAYLSNNYEKLTAEDYTYYYKHKKFPIEKRNSPEAQMASYVLNSENWVTILYTANKVIETSSEIAPYLDSKNNSKLLNNNAIIVASSQIFQLVNDSVKHDSTTIVERCIEQQVKASILQKVTYQDNYLHLLLSQVLVLQ